MPNRIIKESILTSETTASLDDFTFRLSVSLICLADDFGRGKANPAIIKGQAFSLRDEVTKEQVERGLQELVKRDMIHLYQCGDTRYYYFVNWEKHQTVRAKKSKYPSPNDENCKHLQADEIICKQMQADESKCKQMNANVSVIQSNPIQSIRMRESNVPTLAEIESEISKKGYSTNPSRFYNYYNAIGWKIKGQPIEDWKSLLKTWADKDKKDHINDTNHFDDLQEWVNMTRK